MSGLLTRAGEFFVAAAPAATPEKRVTAQPAATAAVLATPDVVVGLACATATALRRAVRARSAVVCLPRGTHATGAPALPGARRITRRLAGRGLEAQAAASLCIVTLPGDPDAAVRDVWRTIAAAPVPVVFAMTARRPELDGLLRETDLIVLGRRPDDDPLVTELAAASLETLGPRVKVVAAAEGPIAARAAAWGVFASDLEDEPPIAAGASV